MPKRPNRTITYPQMIAALREFGFEKDPERSGLKHTTYAKAGERLFIVLPAHPATKTVWGAHLAGVRFTLRHINPADEQRFNQMLGLTDQKADTNGAPATPRRRTTRGRKSVPSRGDAVKKVKA